MDYKFLDKDGLLYVKQKIATELGKKVDKVDGKGLSTNDLTNDLKLKYDNTAEKVKEIVETGGEPNLIDTVKVNGTPLVPDSNKAVNVEVPTDLKDLTNNGNGTAGSKYATEGYVDTNGGKIDKIQVNGADQTITNKTVNIAVPTNSDIEGIVTSKGYQTSADVESAITGKGYQTSSQVESAITGKGYQTSAQVESAITGKGYQTASDVSNAISTAISSTYKASGTTMFENLPSLAESVLGNVYNISNDFTTTADFVEGAGKLHRAGSNVAIVKIGTDLKYDVMSGFIDLSGYVEDTEMGSISNDEIDEIFD